MTVRHRVALKDPKAAPFSVGFSLYCADVNQGCNGGDPFLTAMWSQNIGLVQSSCTGRSRLAAVVLLDGELGRSVQGVTGRFEECFGCWVSGADKFES